jgi:hypothetical protein
LKFALGNLPDQRFLDDATSGRGLPFHRWSLVTLDYTLKPIACAVWNLARVKMLRFPELNVQVNGLLHWLVELVVSDVRQVDPKADNDGRMKVASVGGAGTHHRRDPLPCFCFETKIDGITADPSFTVSKIDAFGIGENASRDLVFTTNYEANADPYRNWLSSGNAPRNGSIVVLDTSFNPAFTVYFTGLRVSSVYPPITTHSPNPGTVRLTYSDIRFGSSK